MKYAIWRRRQDKVSQKLALREQVVVCGSMRKPGKKESSELSKLSLDELMKAQQEVIEELARRKAEELPEAMTMSQMEQAAEAIKHQSGPPAILAMLSRMRPEKPTAKACPRCGKRAKVKARDRERTVQSLSGPVTFKRNYHYCEDCRHGFYPVDYLLGLPADGDMTAELERRILDFGVNDTFAEAADRWQMHYSLAISAHLIRLVVERVGRRCQAADEHRLQVELLPEPKPGPVLVVQNDGSMLPLRGQESWKEAKVAVLYRHSPAPPGSSRKRRERKPSARYVAVLGQQEEFAKSLKSALVVEHTQPIQEIVWVGDGAASNWCLADQLAPKATQILDWYHAVEHAVDGGKALLGEQCPYLELWKKRAEQLLMTGQINQLIGELMDCLSEATDSQLKAVNDLIRYYRKNSGRMAYQLFRQRGLPIASGVVESAHRHVLQKRMKRAGQHWSPAHARRMVGLRAAYRTSGPSRFYGAIDRAHRATPNTERSGVPSYRIAA